MRKIEAWKDYISKPEATFSWFCSAILWKRVFGAISSLQPRKICIWEPASWRDWDEEPSEIWVSTCCLKIREILETYTQKGFSGLRFTTEEKELREEIKKSEKEVDSKVSKYEREIYEQTGLKMIYPYPKEVSKDSDNLPNILNCEMLSVKPKKDINLVDYRLTPPVKSALSKKNSLTKGFNQLMKKNYGRLTGNYTLIIWNSSDAMKRERIRRFIMSCCWLNNTSPFVYQHFKCL